MRRPSLAYIAGFFDGEGSVGAYRRRDTSSGRAWRLVITNTDKAILEAIARTLGGTIRQVARAKAHWSPSYQLIVSGRRRVHAVLENLFPHLRLKRRTARKLLRMSADKPPTIWLCSVRGCRRIHLAKGLCSMHYQRMMARRKREDMSKMALPHAMFPGRTTNV